MTLTIGQITDIRKTTGDNAMPYRLEDSEVQAMYDQAAADAPQTTLVWPYTYVYCLRRLWGLSRLEVDRNSEYGDRVLHSQISDTTKELLDYWERIAGLSGGGQMIVGTLNLGLDTTDDD